MTVRTVVLTGGRSRRFGGVHKPAIEIAGRTVLERILDAVAAVRPTPEVILAGSAEGVAPAHRTVREEPAFSGPLAGIAAAVGEFVPAADATVLLVAGDLPFLTSRILQDLVERCEREGTVASAATDGGQPQYLLAAWPEPRLRARLDEIANYANRQVRLLYEGLEVAVVHTAERVIADIDSPAELARLTGASDRGAGRRAAPGGAAGGE